MAIHELVSLHCRRMQKEDYCKHVKAGFLDGEAGNDSGGGADDACDDINIVKVMALVIGKIIEMMIAMMILVMICNSNDADGDGDDGGGGDCDDDRYCLTGHN